MLDLDKIRMHMKERDWTDGELARRAGVSPAMVSRVMSRQREAGIKTLSGIRKAFPDVPIGDIFKL